MPAPALIPIGVAAGKALAAYAAMVGTHYALNEGGGRLINYAERRTRRRGHLRTNRVVKKIQKAYYSPGGQFARGFVAHAAGAALSGSGKKKKKKPHKPNPEYAFDD